MTDRASGDRVRRLFWIEQRYVVPVMAESPEQAEHIAFQRRTDIARECGPVSTTEHVHRWPGDRDGWDDCRPYGDESRTVREIEEAAR